MNNLHFLPHMKAADIAVLLATQGKKLVARDPKITILREFKAKQAAVRKHTPITPEAA